MISVATGREFWGLARVAHRSAQMAVATALAVFLISASVYTAAAASAVLGSVDSQKEYASIEKALKKDSSNLFHAYYLQFATKGTYYFVETQIGIEKLKTSKDGHLNDLYSHSNGGRGGWIRDHAPINMTLIREAGETNSQCTHTCVSKSVAREMLNQLEAAQ